jgi:hypothetical protein
MSDPRVSDLVVIALVKRKVNRRFWAIIVTDRTGALGCGVCLFSVLRLQGIVSLEPTCMVGSRFPLLVSLRIALVSLVALYFGRHWPLILWNRRFLAYSRYTRLHAHFFGNFGRHRLPPLYILDSRARGVRDTDCENNPAFNWWYYINYLTLLYRRHSTQSLARAYILYRLAFNIAINTGV